MALTLPNPAVWARDPLVEAAQIDSAFQAPWLRPCFEANEWEVAGIGHQRPTRINFDVELLDGRPLSLASPRLLRTVKCYVFWLRSGPLAAFASGAALGTAANNLLTLAAWMLQNGMQTFDELTPLDLDSYTSVAIHGKASILEVDTQLEGHLEALCDEAERACRPPCSFEASLRALLPTQGRSTKSRTFDHSQFLRQVGLPNFASRRSVRLALGAIAREAGLRTTLPEGPPESEDDKSVSNEHLRRILMSFEYLYQYRALVDDGLRFNPFPGSSSREVANRLGTKVGRTDTVPPLQAMTLIERSIRWVVDYSEPLLELQRLGNEAPAELPAALDSMHLSGLGAPRLCRTNSAADSAPTDTPADWKEQVLSLDQALRYLATACATTIAAFSARRSFEVTSARVGCIRQDKSGGYWLTTFIHKSLQRDSSIPVPAVVARAVEVLERLSATARRITGRPYLLQLNETGTQRCLWTTGAGHPAYPFRHYLTKFGLYLDVPPTDEGGRWLFKPHQTRRFFAIVYIWIYELGEFGALTHHLRHFDMAYTMRYVSEEEVGKIVRLVRRERTALILAKAAAGYGTARSAYADRLKSMAAREYDRLMLRMQVLPAGKYLQRLERMVELGGVTLSAAAFGFDSFGPADASVRDLSRAPVLPEDALKGTAELHREVAQSNARADIRVLSAAWPSNHLIARERGPKCR